MVSEMLWKVFTFSILLLKHAWSFLLTLLFLMDRNVIQQPVLSLSKNLMSSSFKYFTGITSVEVYGAYEKWVKYFLQQLNCLT